MSIAELKSMIDFLSSYVGSDEQERKENYLDLEVCYEILDRKELSLLNALRR